MRLLVISALILSVGGCTSSDWNSDLTPEQRATLAAAVLSRPQPQPYYLPMPAAQAAPVQSAPRTCNSWVSGQMITTNCY